MTNCERCKEKITLTNLHIFHDKEAGETKKYCRKCADIIIAQNVEKQSMIPKKEKEDTVENITEEQDQMIENFSEPESDLSITENMKTEVNENLESKQIFTDIVPRENILDKLNSYLSDEGLNITKDDYCYIKIVKNHLEIGRAKIILEE